MPICVLLLPAAVWRRIDRIEADGFKAFRRTAPPADFSAEYRIMLWRERARRSVLRRSAKGLGGRTHFRLRISFALENTICPESLRHADPMVHPGFFQ